MSPKPPPGTFKILYFSSATTHTKKDNEFLSAPLAIGKLYDVLDEKYPGIKRMVLDTCMVTVNLEYIDLEDEPERELKEGDEVAIIPPVSSG